MSKKSRGKGGGSYAAGPGGECICPSCGYKVPHRVGVPCMNEQCPKCGSSMNRLYE